MQHAQFCTYSVGTTKRSLDTWDLNNPPTRWKQKANHPPTKPPPPAKPRTPKQKAHAQTKAMGCVGVWPTTPRHGGCPSDIPLFSFLLLRQRQRERTWSWVSREIWKDEKCMKSKYMKNNLIKIKEMPESELCPETVPAAAWSNYLPSNIKALICKNKVTSESWGCCWNRPARALPTRGRLGEDRGISL